MTIKEAQNWIYFFNLVEEVLIGKTELWEAREDVRAWINGGWR